MTVKVLICDDTNLIRKMFSEMLSSDPDIEVVGTAVDAQDARTKIKALNPDVLTLDIEMPGMDGISFLEKIMTLRPMPVIMASTLTQKGAAETIHALEIGAVDYISKASNTDSGQLAHLRDELIEKVKAAAQVRFAPRKRVDAVVVPQPLAFNPNVAISKKIIAIGSSTGGVETLRDIFQKLPANLPPIVMVQHMPAQFTPSLAARLNSISAVEVAEAEDGMILKNGHAYLAPGGKQMKIINRGAGLVCSVQPGALVSGHCPSVDVLFESVSLSVGADAVGIILTGMGRDGAAGMLKMRQVGSYNIGQSQGSCVVYGMPKAAMAEGAVHTEIPLSEIPAHLISHLQHERKTARAN